MDYVVFGIGFGATILVLGLLVRDIGPRLRYRKPAGEDGIFHAEELVARVSWGRFCSALGAVLAIGGMLFLMTTVVCMVLRLSDETGGWVMIGSLAFLLLLLAYWTWAFFDRFGSYGILPEREEEPAPIATPVAVERPALTERRPAPREASATSEAGKPAGVDGASAEPESDDVSAEPEVRTATDSVSTQTPDDEEAPAIDANASVEPEEPAEAPLETPEERLAHMETPIDHGSAEGELDIAAGGPRRPAPRPRRVPSSAQQEPRSTADPASASDGDRQDIEDVGTPGESDDQSDREST